MVLATIRMTYNLGPTMILASFTPPCLQDITPTQGQQLINVASTLIGTPYGLGPGHLVCTGLACKAIRPLIPKFPEGPASGWGNHNNLRVVGPKEPLQPGDVIRFAGHVGLYDPRHGATPVISATGYRSDVDYAHDFWSDAWFLTSAGSMRLGMVRNQCFAGAWQSAQPFPGRKMIRQFNGRALN